MLCRYSICSSTNELHYELVEDYTINSFQIDVNLKFELRRTHQEGESLHFHSMILPHHLALSFRINNTINFNNLPRAPILKIPS
jgi:hypothetical protein